MVWSVGGLNPQGPRLHQLPEARSCWPAFRWLVSRLLSFFFWFCFSFSCCLRFVWFDSVGLSLVRSDSVRFFHHVLKHYLTHLELHSRFGDKPLKFQINCPQNETAVLKGLSMVFVKCCSTDWLVRVSVVWLIRFDFLCFACVCSFGCAYLFVCLLVGAFGCLLACSFVCIVWSLIYSSGHLVACLLLFCVFAPFWVLVLFFTPFRTAVPFWGQTT